MLKKSKNWHFSKGVNSWVWSKNGHYSNFFFCRIQARKSSLTVLYDEKTQLAIKTRSLKSQKIDIFPKRLNHGFGQKNAIFPNIFFQAIQPRKMSFTICCNEKTLFYAIKATSSKSQNNSHFYKGDNSWFLSKIDH